MAYGESNVTNDVTCPRKVKVVTPICLGLISFKQLLEMLFSVCIVWQQSLIIRVCCGAVRSVGYPSDSLASCFSLGQIAYQD